MIFRIYHETAGGHVHMRMFAGQREGALGKCGDLCLRVEEFERFRDCSLIDFRPEDRGAAREERGFRTKSTDEIRSEIAKMQPLAELPQSLLDTTGTMAALLTQARIAALEWVLRDGK